MTGVDASQQTGRDGMLKQHLHAVKLTLSPATGGEVEFETACFHRSDILCHIPSYADETVATSGETVWI